MVGTICSTIHGRFGKTLVKNAHIQSITRSEYDVRKVGERGSWLNRGTVRRKDWHVRRGFRPSKSCILTLKMAFNFSRRQDIPHDTFVQKPFRYHTLILRLTLRIKVVCPRRIVRPVQRYTPAHLTRIYPRRYPFERIPITTHRSAEFCR